MPEHVTFFTRQEDYVRPTVSIFEDGSYKEHRSFTNAKRPVVYLSSTDKSGPTQKQLDLAGRFASVALRLNCDATIEFKPQTSPWTYDFLAESLGKEFVRGYAGPRLGRRRVPEKAP